MKIKLNSSEKLILKRIQKEGSISKSDILEETGFKLTTLNRVMNTLTEQNLIVEVGEAESTGGRKPKLYGIRGDKHFLVGIDISRTYINVVIVDLKMNLHYNERFDIGEEHTVDISFQKINDTIRRGIEDAAIAEKDILAVGIGTIGPLSREKKRLLDVKYFKAQGWANLQLAEKIDLKGEIPTFVDNGVYGAVLLENTIGYGRDCSNIAYLNCGISIRAGVINEGNIVRTIKNKADVIGHMTVDFDGKKCSCGNYGCLSSYATIDALVDEFSNYIKMGRTTDIEKTLQEINYQDICQAADQGDELAKELVLNSASMLGVGLSNFVDILNPQTLIISGPLIEHSNLYYQTSKKVLQEKSYCQKDYKLEIKKEGSFKENTIAMGAAMMALHTLLN